MKFAVFASLTATAAAFAPTAFVPSNLRGVAPSASSLNMALKEGQTPIIIGVAADSGCGKSTFMRRLTNIFGGDVVGPLGGGFDKGSWETNTLVSDLTTVICLDDYHLNDRAGRKVTMRTALDPEENNFDLMYEQVKALKDGKTVEKPIYNHVNGTLDTPETIEPTPIIIFEGLHPMHDKRVLDLLDFSLYLDISDDVKLNWKVQRDMEERGHSMESILASIEARKPDFDAYIDPQKQLADLIIEVLPTRLDQDDKKTLRVRCIQKEGVENFDPCFLFDEGSSIEWTPAPTKLSSPAPGIKLAYYPEEFFGKDAQVLEMDGNFDNIQELVYVESALSNTKTKFYGEMTQAMLALATAPGSNNGTGLMQTLAAFAIRDIYEKKTAAAKAKAGVSAAAA
ncbi:phosphoribulokinase [Phaeodactylum tricornutum CCAP 1055/1]|jgi:phosphoribulokinase|uniref:Phosphoribulokinase n=1 Tax=Phaeodactylum tricornutum (strain CCAP 1055/1) TaxID=556484 RepID=B5Y5F0_PHATC|nr:phosphoribulokinase [Phaeodactylum tricornutum CCAP 1055/1]ACI65926.1 phosphoribulokinase [Phaeodactylum tricornutum CCAP 1055/1]|mmetsp:Transcript_52259/g.138556  ORF Transcript_52259/g.138556 Transcript_52259/m.138556 type:complete len:397 (+) Transcript_52259:61-1251(+)|eukprot:XP_002186456.1 phosphoribulokinase [Phaeodactylum tricornutum CCAP 1055/1]